MTNEPRADLSPIELVTALKEATKVQVAVNFARLVTPIYDEDGNDRAQEDIDADLEAAFSEQAEEFERVLAQTISRMAKAKAEAQSGLQVVEGDIETP